MSPEQARGDRNLDARVDLYACGVILYEALTGRRPFLAPNYNALLLQILTATPRPAASCAPRSSKASTRSSTARWRARASSGTRRRCTSSAIWRPCARATSTSARAAPRSPRVGPTPAPRADGRAAPLVGPAAAAGRAARPHPLGATRAAVARTDDRARSASRAFRRWRRRIRRRARQDTDNKSGPTEAASGSAHRARISSRSRRRSDRGRGADSAKRATGIRGRSADRDRPPDVGRRDAPARRDRLGALARGRGKAKPKPAAEHRGHGEIEGDIEAQLRARCTPIRRRKPRAPRPRRALTSRESGLIEERVHLCFGDDPRAEFLRLIELRSCRSCRRRRGTSSFFFTAS